MKAEGRGIPKYVNIKLKPIVYLSYMSSRARPIPQKLVFESFLKNVFLRASTRCGLRQPPAGFCFEKMTFQNFNNVFSAKHNIV